VFLAGARLVPEQIATMPGSLGAAAVSGVAGGVTVPVLHGQVPGPRDVLLAMSSSVVGTVGPDLAPAAAVAGLPSPWLEPGPQRLTGSDWGGWPSTATVPEPGTGRLTAADRQAANDLFLRATSVEPRLTAVVGELASQVDGRLVGLDERLKSVDSIERKLAGLLRRGDELPQAAAGIRDSLRYTVVLDEQRYTSGVETAMRTLVSQGYESVAVRQHWLGAAGYRGLNTFWSDPVTSHVFEIQFHTSASYLAKSQTHPLYAMMRDLDEADPRRAVLLAEHNAAFEAVATPAGVEQLGLGYGARSGDAGAAWPASAQPDPTAAPQDRLVGDLPTDIGDWPALPDQEAAALIRGSAFATAAGLAFYPPGDPIRAFAEAVRPASGYLTLDLHGSSNGFRIGANLISPEQLAAALRQSPGDLETVISLETAISSETRIKLLSCDTAVGGSTSPAARLARALGVAVLAPDHPVWTMLDGTEIVATPVLVDGLWVPTHPPDGTWRLFHADGTESNAMPTNP
jgi:hypothetical protein